MFPLPRILSLAAAGALVAHRKQLDTGHPSSDRPVLRSSRKVAFASLIGTTIEWYDFFIFGTAAALIFNQVFFPSFDPLNGTLAAFASFSVGFLARPVGGAVFAHYGDKIGRKPMLVYSLLLMGAATLLMGLLPGYGSIGIWAPSSARPAALRSGLRRRRGVGWCGANGRRACPRAPTRLLRRVATGWRAGRPRPRNRYLCSVVGDAVRQAVPRVGMAGSVPGQRGAHRRGFEGHRSEKAGLNVGGQ